MTYTITAVARAKGDAFQTLVAVLGPIEKKPGEDFVERARVSVEESFLNFFPGTETLTIAYAQEMVDEEG